MLRDCLSSSSSRSVNSSNGATSRQSEEGERQRRYFTKSPVHFRRRRVEMYVRRTFLRLMEAWVSLSSV